MAETEDVVTFLDGDPDENPWVHGKPLPEILTVVPYDPAWPEMFKQLESALRGALGASALGIEHVGSTAVSGLAAKPVIDIDLIVKDPADEAAYLPMLEKIGYDLTTREPSWYQHRCLCLARPRTNLHVFGPDCPEHIRHLLFRDWLTEHPEDRLRYEEAKRAALPGAIDVMEYNARKTAVIRDIYNKAFIAAGYLPATSGATIDGEGTPSSKPSPLDRKMIVRGLLAAAGTVATLFVLLFASSGTWDWWQGWAHVAMWFLYMAIGTPWLLKAAPDMLKRRMKFGPRAEEEPDQKIFIATAFPVLISLYVVAGLDRRFGWSTMPTVIIVAGMVLVVAGMALAVAASLYNHYAAATITVEQGQPVIDTGPYAWVRHPMYSGVLLWFAATPLALGSWWALIPTLLMAVGLYFRIRGEERHLRAQLPGYEEYCRKVRWRLVPGLI